MSLSWVFGRAAGGACQTRAPAAKIGQKFGPHQKSATGVGKRVVTPATDRFPV